MLKLFTEVTRLSAQQTRDAGPTLVYCWPAVYDVGPTVNQRLCQRLMFAGRAELVLAEN